MSTLNPEHLLEQADRLIATPSAGAPRQVDLRRAISGTFHARFHLILTALANEIVALQNERHRVDDDVSAHYTTSSARSAVAQNRRGVAAFRGIEPNRKKMFLTLLPCPPR